MVKKRGLGHVEAVITLVIFIGFLIFAFTFFNPFRANRTLTSTLDYSWREVEDATSDNIESYSVVIGSALPQLVAISIPGTNLNASVVDSSGNKVLSFTDLLGGVHFARPTDNFAVIRYSKQFTKGSTIAGTPLTQSDYIISSSDSKLARYETLFLELNRSYYSNYTGLKKQFNLPNRVEFGFSVIFADGSKIEAYQNIPAGVEILSKSDRVEIVRLNGIDEYGEVFVRVW